MQFPVLQLVSVVSSPCAPQQSWDVLPAVQEFVFSSAGLEEIPAGIDPWEKDPLNWVEAKLSKN